MSHTAESAQAIANRMDLQRAQLRGQFLRPPSLPDASSVASPSSAMQPYQPRSLLMRLLMSNPQLIQRVAVLLVTTVVGARYSSWGLRLLGLLLAARGRR
ncbi:MAG: hypothetical protein V4650_09325 [Pseudomonadota bacterium]